MQTLTTGIVRAWSVYGSPAAAARLSLPLLIAAGALLWLERMNRLGQSYGASSARWRTLVQTPLPGLRGWAASGFCLLLLTLGLLLPAAWLLVKGCRSPPRSTFPTLRAPPASPWPWPGPARRSRWAWRPCWRSASAGATGPSAWPASATPRPAR
ncbi:MAG: hypothetical protein WDM92_11980 [Caulobacteraceae bacterium]